MRHRAGRLPTQGDLETWLEALRERADSHPVRPSHPALRRLSDQIGSDPVVATYAHQMIVQEPGGSRCYSECCVNHLPHLR